MNPGIGAGGGLYPVALRTAAVLYRPAAGADGPAKPQRRRRRRRGRLDGCGAGRTGLHRHGSHYQSKYYAGGYPDDGLGVCTDVIWQALQAAGYDLKALVDAAWSVNHDNLHGNGLEGFRKNRDRLRVTLENLDAALAAIKEPKP